MNDYDSLRAQAQVQLEKLAHLSKAQILKRLRSMDPSVFEHLTALVFEQRGFNASVTGMTGDEGVDVLLTQGRRSAVVQCKRYEHGVGQPIIRDLFGTMLHVGADEAYLVTTGMPTRQAREWAFGKPIHLVDGFTFVDWIVRAQGRTGRARRGLNLTRIPAAVWLIALIGLVVFGFVAGQAYDVIANRLALGQARPTEIRSLLTGSRATQLVATEAWLLTTTPSHSAPSQMPAEITPAATTTPAANTSPPPTGTPASTATPVQVAPSISAGCDLAAAVDLAYLWDQGLLGCPMDDAQLIWAAWQPFERGYMLWRSDTDEAYAFFEGTPRRWLAIDERWDGSAVISRGNPPAGLLAPERGFGYVWGLRDDLFSGLGWAEASEKGFCALVQTFEHGFVLRSDPVASCTQDELYNHASSPDWQPIDLTVGPDAAWHSTLIRAASSTDGPAMRDLTSETRLPSPARPRDHGVFPASNVIPSALERV